MREHVAVFAHEHVIRRDADRLGQARVVHHVPVLAVHGHEPLRLHDVEEELELFLRRVPRHVHGRVPAVDHLGAGAVQRVDDAGDVGLVPRDRVRRDHDDVVAR